MPTSSKTKNKRTGAARITNFSAAQKWLYDHVDHERMRIVPYNERTFNLEKMEKLLDKLGNPHKLIKTIHIAGTKGKGSTCAMVTAMLANCGYAVGQYTSPHLVDLRERIAINDQIITHADLTELFKTIAQAEEDIKETLSFFEILTATAFRYFADQAIDVAVIETGLGGRLDSTNVVQPLVTAITQISSDHTNILGKDLASIAKEKAGIFKKNVPAISAPQDQNVAAMLDQVAEEQGTKLEMTGRDIDFSFRFEANKELGPHSRVCIASSTSKFEHFAVPLKGEQQALNCGLALSIIDKLKNYGFNLPEEKIVNGLAKTTIAGRMEQVLRDPRVIIDGAHNAASIKSLIRALGAHIPYDSLILIFGCGQDKDIPGMLKEISLGADKVIFTRAKANPRAKDPEELLTEFSEVAGKMAQVAPNLKDSLRLAGRAVSREDIVVITGSFYLAGEAKKYFSEHPQNKKD